MNDSATLAGIRQILEPFNEALEDDAPISGADAVDALSAIHTLLKGPSYWLREPPCAPPSWFNSSMDEGPDRALLTSAVENHPARAEPDAIEALKHAAQAMDNQPVPETGCRHEELMMQDYIDKRDR